MELDFGADPAGVEDSYTALRAMVTAVNARGGNCEVFFPAGTYKIDQYVITDGPSANGILDIHFIDCSRFRIVGYGAKIDVKGDFDRSADGGGVGGSYKRCVMPFQMTRCSDFIIEGLEIDGNVDQMTRALSVTEGFNYGIWTSECSDYSLRDLNVHH